MGFFIEIGNIIPGMILNEDIHDKGYLLLPKGAIIKPGYIEKLASRGIDKVNVCAERSHYKDIIANPVERFYAESYEDIANIIDNMKTSVGINSMQVFSVVEKILNKVFSHKNSMLLMTGFRGKCDYYYAHSLDVCIYSLITAKAIKLDYNNTVILGIGALLHDIGKTRIPDSILLKKDFLTADEFEKVKQHSFYGYKIIMNTPGFSHDVAKIALQHHERCDGSGYPGNIPSEEISFLSKIVAIADIYDALTSDRVYRKKILPHEAAEYLLCISNSLVDSEIARVFLKNVAIYPRGCQILLNTGEIGVVLDSNEQMPLRPLLKVLTDRDKNYLKYHYELEMQSHPDVFITDIFN